MALSPLNENKRVVVKASKPGPVRTYGFDVETESFTDLMVDGDDAFHQFLRKVFATPRFRHLVYNDQYGSEVEDLIAGDSDGSLPIQYIDQELRRMITEALIYDDRVMDVKDFVITRNQEADSVFVSLTVVRTNGTTTAVTTEVI